MPPVKSEEIAAPVEKIQIQISLDIKLPEGVTKAEQDAASCFQCTNLCSAGYFFICSKEKYSFTAIEQPLIGCPFNDVGRKKLTGKAADLFRFLVLTDSVLQRSIPPKMLGALGILRTYNLIYSKKGKIRKGIRGAGSDFALETFIYLKREEKI